MSRIEAMTVSELIAGGSLLSDLPDAIYRLNYDLDLAAGHDPDDEIDRYGHLKAESYLSLCQARGLPVTRLKLALEAHDEYLTELADESAHDRAHSYY